jgi:hypothetical protein
VAESWARIIGGDPPAMRGSNEYVADDIDAYLALHSDPSAGYFNGVSTFEMLASTAAGGEVGAERLVGATTVAPEPWIVVAADGRFAASINLQGMRAETVAFVHAQTLGRSVKPPPSPSRLVFHRDGRQTLLWTVYKAGELEWRIQMGDSTHDVDR